MQPVNGVESPLQHNPHRLLTPSHPNVILDAMRIDSRPNSPDRSPGDSDSHSRGANSAVSVPGTAIGPSPPAGQPMSATFSYRCVCGADVALSTVSGGSCITCGRHFPARILEDGAAETYTFHGSRLRSSDDPSDSVDDPLLGTRMGHYRIVERLGRGGMGSVYRALDESLQRYVALKVIRTPRGSSVDADDVQRLLQEAIAQARVNHPNVAHIYYVGRQDEVPFLAMELVPGDTLAQRLAGGPLPYEQVIRIAVQVVSALNHCASFDIVHGDIKPSNILSANSDALKLADFGLARRMSRIGDGEHRLAGTPNYLAPEIAQGSAPDIQSDMYALGVTLFEMTFGRLPYSYTGSSLEERLRAHQQASIEFPEQWPDSMPLGWRDLLARLLAKSPQDRFVSYEELLAALHSIQPVDMPLAGRLPRLLACFADLLVIFIVQAVIGVPLFLITRGFPVVLLFGWDLIMFAIASLITFGFVWAQMNWGTTPGKMLFHIQIVDRNGLVPRPQILGLRAPFQFSPVMCLLAFDLLSTLSLWQLGLAVAGLGMVFFLVDGFYALLSDRIETLHDRLLRTRVCMDVGR